MEIRLVVATLFAVTIAFSNGAKRDGVMRKIYALETSMHEDMSYLRDTVDTNRVSIEAILQLLNNSQSGAVVYQQQPEANNDPYDDVRFSEELARFKRAFADEKAIAREQQTNLMIEMSKLSEAISKHLDGITDVVSKLDNRLTKIERDIEQKINDLNEKIKLESERLYANISRLVQDSTENTAEVVKVDVIDIVGHLEHTVLGTLNASCKHNTLTTLLDSQENQTYLLQTVALKLYPCFALSANKEFNPIVRTLRTTRLANASCTHDGGIQGRIEVNHNGVWGTVCDDEIENDNNGATVVCRSLGFSSGIVKGAAYFGQGSGSTWLDNVLCDGTEDDIFNCPRYGKPAIGIENCNHGEDVGVICR